MCDDDDDDDNSDDDNDDDNDDDEDDEEDEEDEDEDEGILLVAPSSLVVLEWSALLSLVLTQGRFAAWEDMGGII